MTHSNFSFLQREFPLLHNLATSAEYHLYTDPVAALIRLRQFGEKLTEFVYDTHKVGSTGSPTGVSTSSPTGVSTGSPTGDSTGSPTGGSPTGGSTGSPTTPSFHNRIKALEEENIFQGNIASLAHNIKHLGNIAAHQVRGTIDDAKTILFSSFKLAKWFYQTYSEENDHITNLKFSPPPNLDARHALSELAKEYASLEGKFNALLAEKEAAQLPAEKEAEIKERAVKSSRKVDLNEAETRELIDSQLRAAGWEVDSNALNYKLHKTLPQKGKNLAIAEWKAGDKWADYALFVGLDFYGIVEAKKYAQDISTDLRQSKVYASLVSDDNGIGLLGEWQEYKVPFLFSTNGRPYLEQIRTKSGIWFLDVRNRENTARPLRAWFSPKGLQEMLSRDIGSANRKLEQNSPDFLSSPSGLGLRDYQLRAIDKVEEAIIRGRERRRALLAMATGTGKTRTVMGLCYRLIQSNRFKRILFLVDRTALGIQAINAFRDNKVDDLKTFADIYQIEELSKAIPDIDTRLHFATVQSMVKRIFYKDDDNPGEIPTIDTYDCIIIDEAHRGYLLDREVDEGDLAFRNQDDYVSKYRQVLDYFDAFAIGLTATPALHTTEIFGKPVFNYSYREAVIDGFLVDHEPPYLIKTKLSEEGIVWEKGERPKAYDKETNTITELDELEDELKFEVEQFNKLVLTENFNRTAVKQLVNHVDPEGEEKTLVFAASNSHADLLVELFKEEFAAIGIEPGDNAIAKITGKAYDPLQLIKLFKNEKFPNIAVTVDLLTTGIDVPQICNVVFMRRVRSRILYEQMLGRATRLCDEIGKEAFRIFDAVRIYEALEDFTNMKPVVANPSATFGALVDEIGHFENDEARLKRQVDQIIAKLQRRKKTLKSAGEQFAYITGGKDVVGYISMLKELPVRDAIEEIVRSGDLWNFLDGHRPTPELQLWSDHEDEVRDPERGYGKAKRPEDYISSFRKYLDENATKIAAIKLIRTKPTELDRKSLKELYMILDSAGYTDLNLRSAWKAVKNEDIAADMISFIRTLSLGTDLVDHETRIRKAVDKIRRVNHWNKVQSKWLDRFEAQLIHETILRKEDIDKPPFNDAGGFSRLNKIFENRLENVLNEINENLYKDTA